MTQSPIGPTLSYMITECGIIQTVARNEERTARAAAEGFGDDVRKLIAGGYDADDVRLAARCAFRFARLAMEQA